MYRNLGPMYSIIHGQHCRSVYSSLKGIFNNLPVKMTIAQCTFVFYQTKITGQSTALPAAKHLEQSLKYIYIVLTKTTAKIVNSASTWRIGNDSKYY